MHKKLAGDLTSLAHSILQMKNKDDVFALQKRAHELYEKLSVLAYVEEYINHTPNPNKTKEELISEIETIEELRDSPEKSNQKVSSDKVVEEQSDKIIEEKTEVELELKDESELNLFEDIEESASEKLEEPLEEIDTTQEEIILEVTSLEEEFKDTISVDVAADLFEEVPRKSLNDKLHGDIQIGLNDRIAFVKNLFGNSQEDFNRVVSQLNTFKTHSEAKKFINKMVKPDYDWTNKEEFEERFMSIIERKFA